MHFDLHMRMMLFPPGSHAPTPALQRVIFGL